jgi:hypothetical protein
MCAHVITEEQCELFAPASGTAHMNVGTAGARQFAKVAFSSIRIVGAPDESKRLKRRTIRAYWL